MKICPVCKKQFDDSAEVCDVCNVPLIQIAACPHCGKPNDATAAFCAFCGKEMKKEPKPEKAEEPAAEENAPAEAEAPVKAEAEAPAPAEESEAAPAKKDKKGLLKVIGIAAAAVLALILLIVIIASAANSSKLNKMVFFQQDGELYYSKLSGKPVRVHDDTVGSIKVSKNGKVVVFSDGGLYVKKMNRLKKDADKITSEYDSFYINDKGTIVTYMKNGALYQYKVAKNDSEKLVTDVAEYYVSSDGKRIVYCLDGDKDRKLGVVINGRDKGTFATDVLRISLSPSDRFGTIKLKNVYYYKGDDLYFAVLSARSKTYKVAENATFSASFTDGTMYVLTVDEEYNKQLLYVKGKASKVVDKNVSRVITSAFSSPVLVYLKKDSDDLCVAIKTKATKFKVDKTDVDKIALRADGKLACYTDMDKNLYKVKIGAFGPAAGVKYAADVEIFQFMNDKQIAYCKDLSASTGVGDLYINKKKIDSDSTRAIGVGKYIYYTQDGMLKVSRGGKGKKIADEPKAASFLPNGKIAFLKNYDYSTYTGDLYYFTGTRAKKIAHDAGTPMTFFENSETYYKTAFYLNGARTVNDSYYDVVLA